jgi:hypothetical protein
LYSDPWYPLSFILQRLTELVQRFEVGVGVVGRVYLVLPKDVL